MTGDSSSNFNGSTTISRSEIAAVVTRLIGVEPRTSVTLNVNVSSEKSITVGGKKLYLGMWESELTSLMGNPSETLSSTYYGYPVYVYGASDYVNFCYVGVSGGKVVYICASGKGFSYMGYKMGDVTDYSPASVSGYRATLYRDKNDNSILHTVVLRDTSISPAYDTSAATVDNEAKLNFHLTNAFRVYHGVTPLQWSAPIAAIAKSYSARMYNEGFFSHFSPEGETPFDRMDAVIENQLHATASAEGENIAAGYSDAVSVTNGWINSAGHRSNMINSSYTYLGVGRYDEYWTQDFFSLMSW
jgi:uncharacterized protein YkwD